MVQRKKSKVRCLECGNIIGIDSSVVAIEQCSKCLAGKKKQTQAVITVSTHFARTKKGPAKDLPEPYSSVFFRSGWERNFARVLCAQKIHWTYERISFTFSMSPSGKPYKTRPFIYIPDFHEEKTGTLWEIKGYLRSQDRSKMQRFRLNYPEDFNKLKACLSKSNKNAIEFYKSIDVPMIYIEDLKTKWQDKVNWE